MNQKKIEDFIGNEEANKTIKELGIKEWKWVKLSDYSQIIMGQSPPSETYNKDGEGLVFYQGKTDFGNINPTPRVYCTKPTRTAKPNDILISVRAPVGPVNIANQNCGLGRGLAALRTNRINYKFLFYWLRFFEDKWTNAGGTTFNAIKKSNLTSLEVPLPFSDGQPDLVLQHKIVHRIEELFSKIDYSSKLREKIEDITVEFHKASLDKIFNSIEQYSLIKVNLTNIAELIMGQSPPSETYNKNQEGLPFYQGKTDFGDIHPTPRIYCTSSNRIAYVNDVLVSIRAPCGPVNLAIEKCGIGRGLAAIRTSKINPLYLYFWFKYYEDKWSLGGGTTFNNIRKSDFEKHNVLIPIKDDSYDNDKINGIIAFLQSIFDKKKEIMLKQSKTANLMNNLKQSILHKAFIGELVN